MEQSDTLEINPSVLLTWHEKVAPPRFLSLLASTLKHTG